MLVALKTAVALAILLGVLVDSVIWLTVLGY